MEYWVAGDRIDVDFAAGPSISYHGHDRELEAWGRKVGIDLKARVDKKNEMNLE